jgi:hypothetical protein
MKIGNLRIIWHKHKWEKVIINEHKNSFGNVVLKVAEKCTSSDCTLGAYRSVYYISCKNAPEAFRIE